MSRQVVGCDHLPGGFARRVSSCRVRIDSHAATNRTRPSRRALQAEPPARHWQERRWKRWMCCASSAYQRPQRHSHS
jgi:hypothetical protein